MKVLIVDDSSFIHLVCKQAFEKAGHTVLDGAFDGEEAVEKARDLQPDVIVMDIAMPKKNGFEATVLIKEFAPDVPVIAVSAVDEDWIRDKAIEAGCFDFLPKPFETLKLIALTEGAFQDGGELKYG